MVLSFVDSPSGPNKPSSLLGIAISLPVLCFVAIALRFNIRRHQKISLKLDDWILLPALIFVIGMGITTILGVKHKVWGYLSSAEPSTSSQTFESKLLEAFTYVQIFALASIKLSALLFYDYVFQNRTNRFDAFNIAKTIMVVLIGLWTIAMILLNSLQCGTHISALWGSFEDYVLYCTGMTLKYLEGSALSNTLLDILILALPLPKIFGLHINAPRKFAISGVFLLAAVGLGASIARSVVVIQIINGKLSTDTDFRLADSLQVFWSMLEAGISLLAVNLPSIWGYTNDISPDSIIASIWSVISLRRFSSNVIQGSNSRGMQQLSGDGRSLHSSSSKAQFVPRVPGQNLETSALYDVEA